MQKVQTWRFRKTGLMQLISCRSVFCCTYCDFQLVSAIIMKPWSLTPVPWNLTRFGKRSHQLAHYPASPFFAILRSNYFRLWQFLEFGFPGTALGDSNMSADLLTSVGPLRIVNKLWYPVVTLPTFSWFCRKPIFDCRSTVTSCNYPIIFIEIVKLVEYLWKGFLLRLETKLGCSRVNNQNK